MKEKRIRDWMGGENSKKEARGMDRGKSRRGVQKRGKA